MLTSPHKMLFISLFLLMTNLVFAEQLKAFASDGCS